MRFLMNNSCHLKTRVLTPADLKELAAEDVSYLVDQLIPTRSIAILVGDSGLGKTPLGISLGLSVATGMPFLERPTKQDACSTATRKRRSRISTDATDD